MYLLYHLSHYRSCFVEKLEILYSLRRSCISYILLDLFYHEQNRFQGHRKMLGFSFFIILCLNTYVLVFFFKKGFGNYLSFFLSQIMVLFEPR